MDQRPQRFSRNSLLVAEDRLIGRPKFPSHGPAAGLLAGSLLYSSSLPISHTWPRLFKVFGSLKTGSESRADTILDTNDISEARRRRERTKAHSVLGIGNHFS